MTAPRVSVVMAAHNGAAALHDTLASILEQQGVEIEVICVDDGSTDVTRELLAATAVRDSRVRALSQPHEGLTSALIRGCAAARGEFIARQDVGDRSLAGRLAVQAACLREDPATAFVSCATRVMTDDGIPLYDVAREARRAPRGTLPAITGWPGPSHHGATMFRRDAYERAGGYRRAFGVAQDFDLWLRLLEEGDHVGMPEVLYEATFSPRSLSGAYRREQMRNARIALACARARRSGSSETAMLAGCAPPPRAGGEPSSWRRAQAHYFIGACLGSRPDLARRHFALAVRAWPLHLRSWARLAATAMSGARLGQPSKAEPSGRRR